MAHLESVQSIEPTKPSVLIINTGGTFGFVQDEAGKSSPGSFPSGNLHHYLLEHPGILSKAYINSWFVQDNWKFMIHELEPLIDSSDMSAKYWNDMVETIKNAFSYFDGFIILHGTNTMEYSASALSFMIKNLTKPVIITGSMVPLIMEGTDAIGNLEGALKIASGQPKIPEVCIYMDGVLLRGNRTIKVSNRINRPFKSPKCQPLVFRKLDGGTLDYNLNHMMNPDELSATEFHPLQLEVCSRIGILHLFPLMPVSQMKAQIQDENLKGLIIVGYGDGYISDKNSELLELLESAYHRNILMVLISQSFPEETIRKDMSLVFQKSGILSGFDMSLPCAVVKMASLLSNPKNTFEENRHLMLKNLAGEIS